MPIKNALASLAVKDVNAAAAWYSLVLDRPAQRPMPEIAEFHFEGGGALQVYQLSERAGAGSCTLAVTDIDEQAASLRRLGIDDAEEVAGDEAKVLMIKDPDGNSLAFAEAVDPNLAR